MHVAVYKTSGELQSLYQSVSLPAYTFCCIDDLLMDCFFMEENYVRVWALVRSFDSICLSYHVNNLTLLYFASLSFPVLNFFKSLTVDLNQSKLTFLEIKMLTLNACRFNRQLKR